MIPGRYRSSVLTLSGPNCNEVDRGMGVTVAYTCSLMPSWLDSHLRFSL